MGPIAFVKENWRVLLLVVFVAFSLVALFIPGGIMAEDDRIVEEDGNGSVERTDNPTNLEYGLGLEGGARVSAPPVGIMVDDLETEPDATVIAQELELDSIDVVVRVHDDGRTTAEVFSEDVTHAEFAEALQAAGADVSEDDVEDGVTAQTREEIIQTIELRINEAGLSGGTAYEESRLGGDHYIVTEVPGMTTGELRELLSDRGDVRIVAYYPGENGTQENETVLTYEDFSSIGSASYENPPNRPGQHYVPVTVDDVSGDDGPSPAESFQSDMNEYGFTGEGVGQCSPERFDRDTGVFDPSHEEPEWCLLTEVDGEVVDAHPMGSDLAQSMAAEEWSTNPTFRMIVPTQQDAHTLAVNLQSGALTAPLEFDDAEQYSINPALADQFKQYSLLIGVLSVLTVSGVVFVRYRDRRVALPMIVTALTEVVVLLGFAALIRMPLDLSHVAGFIAVVGTGVDDLVIIADEVMNQGDVSSQRVFESRFRKAFWVIGAAAATTIIAMSPLAVLSLGDLRGFAIITILGVLVGVLITRPAYGEILQRLLTDR